MRMGDPVSLRLKSTMTSASHDILAQNAAQTSSNDTAAPRAPSTSRLDGVSLGQLHVLEGGALADDEGTEQPETNEQGASDAQTSVAAHSGLGHHAQANNNLICTPGQAVARYAANADRLRAESRIAVRVLELAMDANATSLPDAVPRARPRAVGNDVKDALRGILGIPLNGSQPGWTNCDRCFETYRTEDAAQHTCKELFQACRVCGCPIVRGDNNQLRKHHVTKCPVWHALVYRQWHIDWLDREGFVASQNGQFFDKAAQRVAAAEADAPTVAVADKPTVLRTALLRELQNKELSKIQEHMTARNPLSGIRPKVLTDAVVDGIRDEIKRENRAGRLQSASMEA
ncbi:hypothetical protein AURDEDRAFT_159254 [Auricularia subglabra TFB-10046 SS5]|nr:hypothetical protein AURDEDRAFT_159254 [Auricularia subglabra TFB-10046 SS5]